jgi:hypothetical protein
VAPNDIQKLRGLIGGRPAIPKTVPLGELIARIDALIARS